MDSSRDVTAVGGAVGPTSGKPRRLGDGGSDVTQPLDRVAEDAVTSAQAMAIDNTLPGGPGNGIPTPIPEDQEGDRAEDMIGRDLGSYRILEVLGEGGMGRVYLAEHRRLGRQVALKMLHRHLAHNKEVVKRFFAEARAVNTILHEHIVEITDFIENDHGNSYFIMEYLRGTPLSQVDPKDPELGSPLARCLSIGAQVASALSAVHSANIIHRDLKPENIFLTEKGGQKDFVKILDFGIAKLTTVGDGGVQLNNTQAGAIMGTPSYMSPEQASAQPVDLRTDIYALGIILYEMCTLRLPFIADNFGDLVVMHKTQAPVPPMDLPGLVQKIPKPLNDLILHCLEKKPYDRPRNAKVVEARLHEIAWEYAIELENFDPNAPSVRTQRAEKPKTKSKTGLLVGAVVGVAAIAVLAFALMRGADDKESKGTERPTTGLQVSPPPKPPVKENKVVELHFNSKPPGASVYAEKEPDKLLGITPFTLRVDQKLAMARFILKKEGYLDASEELSLAAGGTLKIVLGPAPESSPDPANTPDPQ